MSRCTGSAAWQHVDTGPRWDWPYASKSLPHCSFSAGVQSFVDFAVLGWTVVGLITGAIIMGILLHVIVNAT